MIMMKHFQRFYSCLKACKDSSVFCKPIIGLDDCFLKGKYGGELLSAVGRNANDQLLPLAYAVVEVENKETWTWVLELLIGDLGGIDVCRTIVHEVIQHGCLQLLQPEVKEEDWDRNIPI